MILTYGVVASAAVALTDAVAQSGATQPVQEVGPRIQFEQPSYDFGRVTSGETIRHTFVFTNAGQAVLLIKDVHATCACTRATKGDARVDPGKTGRIDVEFRTTSFSGPVSKTLIVSCNDSNHPNVTLELKGLLWVPIEVKPPTASFIGALDSASNACRTLRIINKQAAPLILSEPKSTRREFAVELRTNQPGSEYELLVKLVPPLGSGNLFGNIQMTTSATNLPWLNIPVWAIPQVRK